MNEDEKVLKEILKSRTQAGSDESSDSGGYEELSSSKKRKEKKKFQKKPEEREATRKQREANQKQSGTPKYKLRIMIKIAADKLKQMKNDLPWKLDEDVEHQVETNLPLEDIAVMPVNMVSEGIILW